MSQMGCQRGCSSADDDVSLLVALIDVPVSLDDLLPRITSIDDRLELARHNQLLELTAEEGRFPGPELVGRSIDGEIDACLLERGSLVAPELVHSDLCTTQLAHGDEATCRIPATRCLGHLHPR